MTVKRGDKVKVNYTGRFTDGEVFDSSEGREPLEFTVGAGQVIPGFEHAVEGMEAGDVKTVTIVAIEAYGPRREDLSVTVDRNQLPEGFEPEVGMRLQSRQPDGSPVFATITAIEDAKVTLDANHPLAGKDLVFDIELVEAAG